MKHIALHLKDIQREKGSSHLLFQAPNVQKRFFFHEGSLVSATTSLENERLGKILYKLGKIPWNAFSKIESFIMPDKLIGETLVSEGLITPQDLYNGLSFQKKEMILNTFPYFDAEITSPSDQEWGQKEHDVNTPVSDIIIAGIRRMSFDPQLKAFFKDSVIQGRTGPLRDLLNENEKEVLKAAGSGTPAVEIVRTRNATEEVRYKILYLLYCLDLIELGERLASPPDGKKEGLEAGGEALESGFELDIREVHSQFILQDYYQILGISRRSSQAEAKEAYFRLAKLYHPDIFPRDLPQELKDMVDEIFDRINKAFQTICDDQKRQIYNSRLGDLAGVDKSSASSRAEAQFRKGKSLFDSGDYEGALSFFSEAVRIWKGSARYYRLLGMTKARIPLYSREAESDLSEAIRLEAWNPENYIALGRLYKSAGLSVKATRQFEKALSLDPDHAAALQELGRAPRKKKKGKIFQKG